MYSSGSAHHPALTLNPIEGFETTSSQSFTPATGVVFIPALFYIEDSPPQVAGNVLPGGSAAQPGMEFC